MPVKPAPLQILLIEDDPVISELIGSTLIREGYACTYAADGRAGAEAFELGRFDLILLDLMLPEIGGYDLLEYFRGSGTPVIIISALDRVSDRIRGLRNGADDYLGKPFQIGELLARVESVLRRAGKLSSRLAVADIVVDTTARTCMKAGCEIELTAKEFDLLIVLLQHKGAALSRSYLYETVWGEEYTGETRSLDNHIQRLRKKLGLSDQIRTVFRIGYRLEDTHEALSEALS